MMFHVKHVGDKRFTFSLVMTQFIKNVSHETLQCAFNAVIMSAQ